MMADKNLDSLIRQITSIGQGAAALGVALGSYLAKPEMFNQSGFAGGNFDNIALAIICILYLVLSVLFGQRKHFALWFSSFLIFILPFIFFTCKYSNDINHLTFKASLNNTTLTRYVKGDFYVDSLSVMNCAKFHKWPMDAYDPIIRNCFDIKNAITDLGDNVWPEKQITENANTLLIDRLLSLIFLAVVLISGLQAVKLINKPITPTG